MSSRSGHNIINLFLAATLMLVASLTACQKSSINGFLDGQWQVMSVEPEVEHPLFDSRIYYCFYLHVCQLSIPGQVWITANMSFSDDQLTISFPRNLSEMERMALREYGITSNPQLFRVEKNDNKHIILKSKDSTVTLRKF